MFILSIVIIFLLSFLLAVSSLWRQNKLEEIKKVRKSLKKQKVIYQR
ncbi:MAG: hypothetical protein AAB553_03505 [Patescibacteria group bacterium]